MPDFPPVFTDDELDVYKYLAGRLDPAKMHIQLIGTGGWTPTEDIVIYSSHLIYVGAGETEPITHHDYSKQAPFGFIRVKAGEQITGVVAASSILYANVSDLVYSDPRRKFYERLRRLLSLGHGDLTLWKIPVDTAGTSIMITRNTGTYGTIVLYAWLVGVSWSWMAEDRPGETPAWWNFGGGILTENLISLDMDYSDRLGNCMPMLALPANKTIRIGAWGEFIVKPSGDCNAQYWVYDVPANW